MILARLSSAIRAQNWFAVALEFVSSSRVW